MSGPAPAFTFGHYRRILESGLESGYLFIGFEELAAARDAQQYLCLLRHDCEGDLVTALRLGELENELGIRSTYFVQLRSPLYNVLSRPQARFVRGLLELGHRLGLHFDERSYDNASPAKVADLVDSERALLGAEFGVSVEVVSFHQPSARVLENKIKLRCLNTYDRSDMLNLGYLSDSNWRWREDPIEAFHSHTHPHLQLLLHPECWTDTSMPAERKWHKVLRDNVEIAQQTLLEREETYKRRARISFRT
jgi:hypothetical protein